MARGWHGRRERRVSHLAERAPARPEGEARAPVTTASLARAVAGPRQPAGGIRSRLHAGRATEVRSGKVLGPATRAAAASRKTSVRPPCRCSRSPRRRCRATASDLLAAGFDSYLSKPVNVVKLIHTVRQQCPDVGREGPLPARPALALAHPGALAGLPSCGDGWP